MTHDYLVFVAGALGGQILAIIVGLCRRAIRRRLISDRLGPPAP